MSGLQRVVIIDDDVDYLDIVAELLMDEGATVETFADAHRGISRLGAAPRPSVVVCDLNMDGFRGLALLDAIRARQLAEEPAIVVVTADARYAKLAISRACAVLVKPVHIDELLAEIRRCGQGSNGATSAGGSAPQNPDSDTRHELANARQHRRRHQLDPSHQPTASAAAPWIARTSIGASRRRRGEARSLSG